MFSKKKTVVLALLLMVLPILASCGGESTATPAPAATNTSAPVAAATNTTAAAAPTNTTAAAAATATTAVAPTTAVTATTTVSGTTSTSQTASATDTLYSAKDCSYGGTIKSIQAVDDNTVKFTLCLPDPAFPSKVAFSSVGIQSEKHLQETGGGGPALLQNPIGTGPYMVKAGDWVQGDHITFTANPNYWGDPPKSKTVVLKWNAQAAARLAALKSGEANGMDNPDTNDFASIQADSNLKLYPRDALNIFYLGTNNTKPPLDNEKVRQAIAQAIDKQAIVTKFYPKGSSVADFFTPCAIPGGCEGDKWYAYNLDAAKKLIQESGVPTPINLKLSYRLVDRSYLPTPDKVAEEIQSQLKNIGINATIDQQESGTFLDNASKGNLELFLLGWGADFPDQTDFMDPHFGKGAAGNFGNKWPDITTLITQAGSTADQTKRNQLYGQINGLLKQHVPMVPVAHGGSAAVFGANVQGAHTSPLGNEHFNVMSVPGKDTLVFLQNAEPLSLYCSDETDGESIRACIQIFDSLLSYKVGGVDVVPGLAESYSPNSDLTEWTFNLRKGVKFSDGTPLTAKDVVMTYAVQWDAAHPLHKGNTGNFDYWGSLFAAMLNTPPPPTPVPATPTP
jgi:ABC-type transport system substrate-binding protein